VTTKWSPKDPQDIRDYWIDFRPLLPDGVTITAATVDVPSDQATPVSPFQLLAKVSSDIVNDDLWVVARYSGGTPGKYSTQYHITASDGQQFDLTKILEVKERIQ